MTRRVSAPQDGARGGSVAFECRQPLGVPPGVGRSSSNAPISSTNAPTALPNQTPQGTVPAPVELKTVMALVPPAEMAKVYRLPGFIADLRTALDDNDHEYMGTLMQIALADGAITAGTAAQLQPLLLATVPDPAWSPTVAGPSAFAAAGFGVVTPADVQGALHAAAE